MVAFIDAQTIVTAALAHARAANMPSMTVAVLDAGGALVAFAREDRSSLLREKIARGKAAGALNLGVGSRSLARRAESHPHFVGALTALAEGNLVPVAGGVLVRDAEGGIIGAVGVSGHLPDADEACAVAGIEAAGLSADPGE
ncbi:GlcG/HbpS family heme-binding protein [Amycolatopsis sp.]|uniref:GlcG/HbpS family heme-binding protein n=1 Tax=Amycolatopsis sp. TaxID=37632 RepID=UPI002E082580|nr:heme-binding protein [Amycolatopsis sp.]